MPTGADDPMFWQMMLSSHGRTYQVISSKEDTTAEGYT